jgi:hypothetical protein
MHSHIWWRNLVKGDCWLEESSKSYRIRKGSQSITLNILKPLVFMNEVAPNLESRCPEFPFPWPQNAFHTNHTLYRSISFDDRRSVVEYHLLELPIGSGFRTFLASGQHHMSPVRPFYLPRISKNSDLIHTLIKRSPCVLGMRRLHSGLPVWLTPVVKISISLTSPCLLVDKLIPCNLSIPSLKFDMSANVVIRTYRSQLPKPSFCRGAIISLVEASILPAR